MEVIYISPNSNQTNALPAEFSKYGDSSLKMKTAALPPGEYAVGKSYGQTVFCFGVDAKP